MVYFVLLHFGGQRRAWSDEAHVAFNGVPELRELVEAVFPEDAADAGDARVVGDLEQNAVALVQVLEAVTKLVGIGDHCSKLVATKDSALTADAVGGIEDWTAGVEADGESDDGQ